MLNICTVWTLFKFHWDTVKYCNSDKHFKLDGHSTPKWSLCCWVYSFDRPNHRRWLIVHGNGCREVSTWLYDTILVGSICISNLQQNGNMECTLPVIIFGMKSLCPGASSNVMDFLGVSNVVWAISMVTPRDLEIFKNHTMLESHDCPWLKHVVNKFYWTEKYELR